jgi:hypothetical protein
MFNDLWFYALVFGVSFTIHFLNRLNLGPFRTILNILGFIGVIIHELSHYALCKILGVKVERVRIQYRNRTTGNANPHGSVALEEYELQSFLQALIVGIAPLFLHSWLIMICLDLLYIPTFNDLVYIGIIFLIVSLFIGSAPSSADLRNCYKGFTRSPSYSLYQLFLLAFSVLTTFVLLRMIHLRLPFDFFTFVSQYVIVALFYFVYKYSFRGINNLIHKSYNNNRVNLRLLTRKRHAPIKPRKFGIEEPHW